MKKNTKTTKRKTTRQKKTRQKYLGERIYFEVILMIVLIPTIVLFLVPIFNKPISEKPREPLYEKIYKNSGKYSIEVTTEKNVYRLGDEMTLSIKNNSGDSIYFEPCEYLNNFEKKVNGVWISERSAVEDKIYDANNFRREENVTNCSVNLPKSAGAGIYRAVVRIYYDCQMPGGDMCSDSKVFYSNEFKVIESQILSK